MKSIEEIVNEAKSAPLNKVHILTIMIFYQMWEDYKQYEDFFKSLDEDELDDFELMYEYLVDLDNNDSRVSFKNLKMYFPLLNKIAYYVENAPNDAFDKIDKKVWKEIKDKIQ